MTEEKKEIYIKSIEEFDKWFRMYHAHGMIYRGLKNLEWELSASLYHRLKTGNSSINAPRFIDATRKLIEKAREERHDQKDGKQMTNLELLAELQHVGAATCLIDFTYNPYVALWFACQPNKKPQDGKIVALTTEKFQVVSSKDWEEDIGTLLSRGQKYLWKWSPLKQNSRIIIQQLVFILGKGIIENKEIDEVCFVDKEFKSSILKELEKQGISESSLFSDFIGFAQQNAWNKPYQDLTSNDYLRNAIYAHQSNNLEEAAENCDKSIEINPQNLNAYSIRGRIKRERGDYNGAIADFNKVIQGNPQHSESYYSRGIAKFYKNDYDGAIADFDKAIEINPKRENAYYYRGHIKTVKGDYSEAIADLDIAIQINPKDENTYYSRGFAKSEKGDYGGAIADYDKVIHINPQYATAYYYRGLINYRLKNYEGAEKDYHKAKKIAPDDFRFIPYQNKK